MFKLVLSTSLMLSKCYRFSIYPLVDTYKFVFPIKQPFSFSWQNPCILVTELTMASCFSHSSDGMFSKPLITLDLVHDILLPKIPSSKAFPRARCAWRKQVQQAVLQVFAVNIPLDLKKPVHPLVCMEICKVSKSIIKANLWSGESLNRLISKKGGGSF
jgi:hypothetical protein